jgi:triacylglycerol esterase/lipase EstA (alpha/beta hydrolase family)
MKRTWKSAGLLLSVPVLAAACSTATPFPASTTVPVESFGQAWGAGLGSPNTAPPGSNVPCTPSASHPYPVILVHGTLENMADNWGALSPTLANAGYCVYAFNYGQDTSSVLGGIGSFDGLGDIAASAGQLSTEVDTVLGQTGAGQVDIVGHSQGGMMPRYYLDKLGGAAKVHMLVGLAPSNHGTTLDGLASLGTSLQSAGLDINSVLSGLAGPALAEQEAGSAFVTALNAGGDTVPGPKYVVVETTADIVVTPYASAFLAGGSVQNITVQTQCPADTVGHIGIPYDSVALADTLNALGADTPGFAPPCDPSGFGPGI